MCQLACSWPFKVNSFAIQIGEYKCFVKGFRCIWAAVPLFKRLLSFQSQVAAGHMFHCVCVCVCVFLWVNCVHADWGGQFLGHGIVCWQLLLLLFLFLVIISCLYVEEDSGCPDSWSNFTKPSPPSEFCDYFSSTAKWTAPLHSGACCYVSEFWLSQHSVILRTFFLTLFASETVKYNTWLVLSKYV